MTNYRQIYVNKEYFRLLKNIYIKEKSALAVLSQPCMDCCEGCRQARLSRVWHKAPDILPVIWAT